MAGIRQMPAHGGNPKLTDTEIERAITYMVNQSGGHWTEPVSRTTKAPERTGKEIVEAQCVKCHGTGVGGAPKIGDRAAWTPRVKQGLDVVVRSAIHGHGAMPPRGGMADLTDTEIRGAIVYMFNVGTARPSKRFARRRRRIATDCIPFGHSAAFVAASASRWAAIVANVPCGVQLRRLAIGWTH